MKILFPPPYLHVYKHILIILYNLHLHKLVNIWTDVARQIFVIS